MAYIHYPNAPLPPFRQTILTIGTFDGVHIGHRKIIEQVTNLAKQRECESVLISFDRHPRHIVQTAKQPSTPIRLLSPLPEKLRLLANCGLDHVVITAFTEDFASQSPEAYLSDFLAHRFAPACIVIGYDHRFGKDRAGGFDLLCRAGKQYSFDVQEIEKQLVADIAVSSTKIRQALDTGNIEVANNLLGYPYTLHGTVTQGKQIGRTIGYPTANLILEDPEKLIPAQGVYAVVVQLPQKNQSYKGLLNIGTRPTVGGTEQTIEVHLLNFSGDLYGQTLSLELKQYLRPEMRFPNLSALVEQIGRDQKKLEEAMFM